MPLKISQDLRDATKPTKTPAPTVGLWFIEADEQTAATTVFQVTPYPKKVGHVRRDKGGGLVACTYYPLPMTWSPITLDGEGNLPRTTLTLDNSRRFLAPYLHTGDGFIGRRCQVILIDLSLIGTDDPRNWEEFEFQVAAAEITDAAVTLTLEPPPYYDLVLPEQRYNPGDCRYRFGLPGGGCPYVLGPRAAHTTCDKSLTDCTERGNDMVTRGYPRTLLPTRYGGFPGAALAS